MTLSCLAVLADIHGNADALRAVLADLEGRGVERVVVLGDHFSGPLAPAETAKILRAHPEFLCIRGNHDRYLTERPPEALSPIDRFTRDEIGAEALAWTAELPAVAEFDDLFLCHGTPASDEAYLLEQITTDGGVRVRGHDAISALLGTSCTGNVVLCGHSHLPRAVRLKDGRQVVNPGSVGCPAYRDDEPVPHVVEARFPEASYAILDRSAGCAEWSVTFRRVPYDSRRMAARATINGRPDWARAVATGWLDP